MSLLLRLFWRWFGDRRLTRQLSEMTLPQLNLLEARMMQADAWSPELGEMFDQFRVGKGWQ